LYLFSDLSAGQYDITIKASGFATSEFRDVVVQAGRAVTVDLELKVASVGTSITVGGATDSVELTQSMIQGQITSATIESDWNLTKAAAVGTDDVAFGSRAGSRTKISKVQVVGRPIRRSQSTSCGDFRFVAPVNVGNPEFDLLWCGSRDVHYALTRTEMI
jgi:hypothetical protein